MDFSIKSTHSFVKYHHNKSLNIINRGWHNKRWLTQAVNITWQQKHEHHYNKMNTENKGHLGQRRPCERNKANTKLNNNMNTTTIKLTRKTMTTKAKEGHVNVTQQRFTQLQHYCLLTWSMTLKQSHKHKHSRKETSDGTWSVMKNLQLNGISSNE